jgi:hypothetical protein
VDRAHCDEGGAEEHALVGQQRRDLHEREHEDEIEEQLTRRDTAHTVLCRRGHPRDPTAMKLDDLIPVPHWAERHERGAVRT